MYDNQECNRSLDILDSICNKLFCKFQKILITIDNSRESFADIDSKFGLIIPGDNSTFEFSGWDAGYKYLINNFIVDHDADLILYANDGFYRTDFADGGKQYIDFFDDKILRVEHRDITSLAIGYLDDFPKEVSLMGINYRSWIRSNLFILSANVSKKLHPIVFPLTKEYLFGSAGEPFFRKVPEISKNWQDYNQSWLFGTEIPECQEYRLKWKRCAPLNEFNRDFFKIKCMTILSEHYLSARLNMLNIEIVNTNLFPSRMDRHIVSYYAPIQDDKLSSCIPA